MVERPSYIIRKHKYDHKPGKHHIVLSSTLCSSQKNNILCRNFYAKQSKVINFDNQHAYAVIQLMLFVYAKIFSIVIDIRTS